jgi:Protein tyrosine and serine/threonine kinase
MNARVEMSRSDREHLMNPANLPSQIVLDGHRYWPDRPAGFGFKSVVWKVKNEVGRPRAVKFAVYEDFLARSFDEERSYAARLEDHQRWFARIDASGRTSLQVAGDAALDCVFFVQEWVEGESLADFLRQHRDEVNAKFLSWYGAAIAHPLAALAAENLTHDDLHAGNVMLAEPSRSDFDDAWRLKVVDLGSLKPLEDAVKPQQDLDHVAEHLVSIFNVVVEDGGATRRDRRFLNEAQRLIEQMVEPDPDRALREPRRISQAFQEAESRSAYVAREGGHRINSPFEFISSEQIADDSTFLDLFAEAPWLSQVAGRDPCLLTGPRGCGKSTLFRWLSLKTQLAQPKPALERFQIAGFYISCSTELEGRFSWIRSAGQAERHEDALVHYFNLVLLRELLDTLAVMRRYEREASERGDELPWRIGPAEETALLRFITENLQLQSIPLAGVGALDRALDLVERERWRCDIAMRRGQAGPLPTPETLVGEFCSLLVRLVPFFENHRIAFLVDDFTARRVKPHVQVVLNRVIRLRRNSMLFKISSEKRGMQLTDSEGTPLDIARELIEIDIGRQYLDLSDGPGKSHAREFALKLLDNRLQAAGWAGRGETLLGHSSWSEYGTLSRALRDGKARDQYHGLECMADLCSGDISTLLLIYRRVTEAANISDEDRQQISKATQHRVVRKVSRDQVDLLRTHVPHGAEMHALVQAFGTFVGNVLRNGREIKQSSTRSVPPTCPRIEVDGVTEAAEQLDDRLMQLFEELVRRAVFVEMEAGLGRHGNVQTLQWQLRRVYLPAFRAALDKNSPVSLTPAEFKFFLNKPRKALEKVYDRWQKQHEPQKRDDDYDQLELVEESR